MCISQDVDMCVCVHAYNSHMPQPYPYWAVSESSVHCFVVCMKRTPLFRVEWHLFEAPCPAASMKILCHGAVHAGVKACGPCVPRLQKLQPMPDGRRFTASCCPATHLVCGVGFQITQPNNCSSVLTILTLTGTMQKTYASRKHWLDAENVCISACIITTDSWPYLLASF